MAGASPEPLPGRPAPASRGAELGPALALKNVLELLCRRDRSGCETHPADHLSRPARRASGARAMPTRRATDAQTARERRPSGASRRPSNGARRVTKATRARLARAAPKQNTIGVGETRVSALSPSFLKRLPALSLPVPLSRVGLPCSICVLRVATLLSSVLNDDMLELSRKHEQHGARN